MDNDYGIDLDAIFEVIDTAEVITFRFVTIPHRLLFDARHSEQEGPLLKVVPRAASLEERFKSVKQLRPRFKLPEKITAIWWPRYVTSLAGCGVWDRVKGRILRSGFPQTAGESEAVLRELIQRERAEVVNAIAGNGYHTLWERCA